MKGTLQVLFRPDRKSYVRGPRPRGCVFCQAQKNKDNLIIYTGAHCFITLNKYPYNTGHLLILPKRHIGDFEKLNSEEHLELHWLLKETIRITKAAQRPAGINVGLNLGRAAGAGIPKHLHYHVIPRWQNDANFFPLVAKTKVVIETLTQTRARLLPFFKKLKSPEK